VNSTEYARRVVAIYARIARMYPNPDKPYDEAEGDWKWAHRRRERQQSRITSLPARWREVPK
jgi:hypothetical protein